MAGRITNQYQNQIFIDQIFQQQKELASAREKIASGFEISKPSDDPAQAATISGFQNLLTRITKQQDRIGYAEDLLTQQEAALSNAQDLMIRAKELASQAANETYSVSQRQQLATEVWSLRNAMVSSANTKVLGRYIFAGTADDAAPVTLNGVAYTAPAAPPSVEANRRYVFTNATGFNQTKSVNITDDEVIRVTSNASTMFQNSINALERLGRTLEGYRTTPEVTTTAPDLGGAAFVFPADFHGQTSAIQNALGQIDTARSSFTVELSDIGGRMNRLTQARQFLDTVKEATEKNRSDIQDADIFEISSKLTSLQTSFQALLASGSQINRLSLLDFL
jgi:flagellar hook-associated protein 3 FlgL